MTRISCTSLCLFSIFARDPDALQPTFCIFLRGVCPPSIVRLARALNFFHSPHSLGALLVLCALPRRRNMHAGLGLATMAPGSRTWQRIIRSLFRGVRKFNLGIWAGSGQGQITRNSPPVMTAEQCRQGYLSCSCSSNLVPDLTSVRLSPCTCSGTECKCHVLTFQ